MIRKRLTIGIRHPNQLVGTCRNGTLGVGMTTPDKAHFGIVVLCGRPMPLRTLRNGDIRMAITLPVAGTELSVAGFGKPVADGINALGAARGVYMVDQTVTAGVNKNIYSQAFTV